MHCEIVGLLLGHGVLLGTKILHHDRLHSLLYTLRLWAGFSPSRATPHPNPPQIIPSNPINQQIPRINPSPLRLPINHHLHRPLPTLKPPLLPIQLNLLSVCILPKHPHLDPIPMRNLRLHTLPIRPVLV